MSGVVVRHLSLGPHASMNVYRSGLLPVAPRMGAPVLVTDGCATCGGWTQIA